MSCEMMRKNTFSAWILIKIYRIFIVVDCRFSFQQMSVFKIEKIVGHKIVKNRKSFLVRFEGLTADEDCWFKEEQIPDKKLVAQYLESAPNVPDYKKDDYSSALDDILTLKQLRYKEPKMVIAAYKQDNKLFYRVEFKNEKFYSVESSILKQVHPELICTFLEHNIVFKSKKENNK